MTVGFSSTHLDGLINVLRATNYTAVSPWVKLHTADPGAAGTTAASAETTRKALTFAAPSTASTVRSSAASSVSWATWSAGSETISHFSVWDASSAGNFLFSGAFTVSRSVVNNDTLTATITVTQGPLAA
jgi:hypothetical protein